MKTQKLEVLINRMYADKFGIGSEEEIADLKGLYYKEGLFSDEDEFAEAADAYYDAVTDAANYREMYS